FGIDANKVTQSIKTTDIKEGLSGLAGTDGKISYDAALDFAKTKGLTNAELASYLGVTPQSITDYIKTSDISKGLSALAGTDGKIDIGQAIIYARNNKLSDAELAGYLGVTPETISNYITNRQTTARLEDAAGEDKKLSYSEILNFAEANNLSLEKVAEYITGPEGRAELVKNINEYKTENSPQVDSARQNLQNVKKQFFDFPSVSALRDAFSDIYLSSGEGSKGWGEIVFNEHYKPGMTIGEVWTEGVVKPAAAAIAQANSAAATTTYVDKSGNPITGINPAELYRLSSFVGTDPVTGKQIRAVNSSQGRFFYDPDIGGQVANLLEARRASDEFYEMTGSRYGTFIEGTNIPYVPGGGKTDQVQVSGTPSVKTDATGAAAKSIAADLSGLADTSGKITYDQIIDYATKNNVSLADVASAINIPTETLTKYQNDKLVMTKFEKPLVQIIF
ncbi:transcriptional regulator, partial [bacterium]|nr:transcriptional regulator [Candidatus Elulimicrobium humile]